MRLGTENKSKTIWAIALGVLALLAVLYEVIPMFSGPGPTQVAASQPVKAAAEVQPAGRRGTGLAKKVHAPENLDPTLRLGLLAASEGTMYEGSGRNIFVSQAEAVVIPKPIAPGSPDAKPNETFHVQLPPPPPPIPLKFFGFASRPGEPKRIFLSKGDDVFIAGEGDIVDRRYKVVRISATSVEMEDVVTSGPPQNIPLTQNL